MGKNQLFLAGAGIFFAIYFLNVILGALQMAVFLSDVGEMLVLFGACIQFVIAVLGLERQERRSR